MVDDYYEDKVLAEITERGLKPGDLVGELADPNAPSAAALAAAELANAQKGDRSGGTQQGIYRAGGPTTLFGGQGWGPYSDGPLNAVRKSLLNRDGLNEENWMLVAAQRAAEANADWTKQRRRALVPYGGIFGTAPVPPAPPGKMEEEEESAGVGVGVGGEGGAKEVRQGKGRAQDQEDNDRAQEQRENEAGTRRRKRARREEKMPKGVYEPHSGIVLCTFFFLFFFLFFILTPLLLTLKYIFLVHSCSLITSGVRLVDRADTQPTRARWEGLRDSAEKRQVLGGAKAGNGAWALAWVDTVMELPASEGDHAMGHAAAEERKRLLELAAADLNT